MQGQRGAIGSFPETQGFDHGSGSSDAGVVDHMPPSNRLSDYVSPTTNTNVMFLDSMNQDSQNAMWTMGDTGSSSGLNQVSHGPTEPRTMDHGWPALMKSSLEPPPNMLQLGDHNSSTPQIVAPNPSTSFRRSIASSSSSFPDPFGPSPDPFEIDNRRLSRKRKAVELSVGQSSSSNMLQRVEIENPFSDNEIIPRLGLGVSSESPFPENPRRNVQLRINSSRQQDPLPVNNNRHSEISSIYPSMRLNPVDFRSPSLAPTTENSNSNSSTQPGPPVLRIPALRRNLQSASRWSRSSSSRINRSSSNLVIPGDRNELDSRTIPSNLSEHPLFAPPAINQTELNWASNRGSGSGGAAGNSGAAAATPAAVSALPNSSTNRNSPHYHPRRLSAFLRRSLLSASDLEGGGGGGGQSSNLFSRIPPPSSSRDNGVPPATSIQDHLRSSSMLMGRQIEGAFGFPYLSRSMMAGSEGRGRLVSEIRNVLDLMRRGEPLRFEDIMVLDQSVFYGIADVHDRHRDMRLDIDNMSYEELLALEERIGNVNTGLAEEKISKLLKQKQYVAVSGQPDAEPCCICQEEYKNGDDLGALECGHDFHRGCIKQWLQQKNSCPICKSTGFAAP